MSATVPLRCTGGYHDLKPKLVFTAGHVRQKEHMIRPHLNISTIATRLQLYPRRIWTVGDVKRLIWAIIWPNFGDQDPVWGIGRGVCHEKLQLEEGNDRNSSKNRDNPDRRWRYPRPASPKDVWAGQPLPPRQSGKVEANSQRFGEDPNPCHITPSSRQSIEATRLVPFLRPIFERVARKSPATSTRPLLPNRFELPPAGLSPPANSIFGARL